MPVMLKNGEKTGRSRGGLTTKVYAVTAGCGESLHFFAFRTGKLILADKGSDSAKLIRWVEERGGVAIIPSRMNATRPRKTDWHTYKERHLIENLFLKLKNHRRFSTRYAKRQTVENPLFCIKQDRGSLHIAGKRKQLY